jgi:hypothetical protein
MPRLSRSLSSGAHSRDPLASPGLQAEREASGTNQFIAAQSAAFSRQWLTPHSLPPALRQTVEHADLADRQSIPRTRLRLGFAVAVDGAAISAFAKAVMKNPGWTSKRSKIR